MRVHAPQVLDELINNDRIFVTGSEILYLILAHCLDNLLVRFKWWRQKSLDVERKTIRNFGCVSEIVAYANVVLFVFISWYGGSGVRIIMMKIFQLLSTNFEWNQVPVLLLRTRYYSHVQTIGDGKNEKWDDNQ